MQVELLEIYEESE